MMAPPYRKGYPYDSSALYTFESLQRFQITGPVSWLTSVSVEFVKDLVPGSCFSLTSLQKGRMDEWAYMGSIIIDVV